MLSKRFLCRQSTHSNTHNVVKSFLPFLSLLILLGLLSSFTSYPLRLASYTKLLSVAETSNHLIFHSPEELLLRPFPKKIWQWWKHGAEIPDGRLGDGVAMWRLQNPDHRYERLSDGDDETFVRDHTSWNPDIAKLFSEISTDTILRSDFVRYIALLMDGGVYADIDTTPMKPIEKWIPNDLANETNLVVGIEMDKGYPEYEDIPYTVGFAQYAIMAKQGHPAILRVVEKVYHNLRVLLDEKKSRSAEIEYAKQNMRQKTEQQSAHAEAHQMLGLSFEDVIRATGPTAFTASIWEYLSERTGQNLTGIEVTNITEPVLISDVLILPINGFGAEQVHSNSGHCNDPQAMVCHFWVSSWIHDYPYESDLNQS